MRSFPAAVVAASLLMVSSASAAVVTYTGFDDGASAPGSNATTARNSFLAAVGASGTLITFESVALGSTMNLTIAPGVTTSAGGNIVDSSACPLNFCGGNTTDGGSNFLEVPGSTIGTLTFNFLTPIYAFGANFGGLQFPTVALTFDDGSTQTLVLAPGANVSSGGFAFAGFTDVGKSITAVSLNAASDLLSIDDAVFATSSIASIVTIADTPEPSSFALLALGLTAFAFRMRNRRAN